MSPGDKPDQAMIDNDVELDKWYEDYVRQIASKMSSHGAAGRHTQDEAFHMVPQFH